MMNFLHFTLTFELVRKKKLMQEAVSAMTADDTNFCNGVASKASQICIYKLVHGVPPDCHLFFLFKLDNLCDFI